MKTIRVLFFINIIPSLVACVGTLVNIAVDVTFEGAKVSFKVANAATGVVTSREGYVI